jgi:hypothetical protein
MIGLDKVARKRIASKDRPTLKLVREGLASYSVKVEELFYSLEDGQLAVSDGA